ncbi:MAG: energy transducer TonB [Fibrobacterota bacterium]
MSLATILLRTALVLAINIGLFVVIPLSQDAYSNVDKEDSGAAKRIVAEIVKPEKKKPKPKQTKRLRSMSSSQGKSLQSNMKLGLTPDLSVGGGGDGAVIAASDIGAEVFEEGDVDNPATPVFTPQPDFPAEAKRLGVGGAVTVFFTVGEDGRVMTVDEVDAPHSSFEGAVRKAMEEWEFSPAMKNGVPVISKKSILIDFSLES